MKVQAQARKNGAEKLNHRQENAIAFARKLHSLGFQVYLAHNKEYGFFTDETEKRVASFQNELAGTIAVSGNYHASRGSGNGWKMEDWSDNLKHLTKERADNMLNARAPQWANKSPVYTTKVEHLATYGKSSKYERLEA